MYRTSLAIVVGCMALWRGALCSLEDGPCEYDEILLVLDTPAPSGKTFGEEIETLEGPWAGTWRWYPSSEELTIDGGGVEFPAEASFEPDLGTLRTIEHVGGGAGAYCPESGVYVDGMLTFTDEQDVTILSIPVTVERRGNATPEFAALPQFSPVAEFSSRLHENVDYDQSAVAGRIHWTDSGIEADFFYGGQSMLTSQTGAGVIRDVADFQ